jgi:phosphatidylserine decarboxylase
MLPLEPMDPLLTWDQPGGGVVVQLELAWGHLRRWWLKTFRSSYLERMRRLRKGSENNCPHEVLDPRDLKFFRNRGGYSWDPADDPFQWRERLPFVRAGLAELLVFSLLTYVPGFILIGLLWGHSLSVMSVIAWLVAVALVVIGGLISWFFRNPNRAIPTEAGAVVAPADGLIVTIEEIEHDDFIGGPAVLVGIFLSIFNVHINRAPLAGRVIGLRYRKGKFLNALRPESARENEQLAVRMQQIQAPHRRFIVRQITGAIARRIVCWLKPGDELSTGEQFGMIKLGSRTELVLPREQGLEIKVKVGEAVKAGSSLIAVFR